MEEVKCEIVGMLNGGGYEKMHDIGRRVYSTNGLAPTMHTCGGGNLEPKIAEPLVYDGFNQQIRQDSDTCGTITRNVGADLKRNGQGVVEPQLRVRKLTQHESFKLMAVKTKDYEAIAENQSKSSLYHLAGDSIVATCIMALFGEMLGIDYEKLIDELSEILSGEKNENYQIKS